jgi:hypothetical protein
MATNSGAGRNGLHRTVTKGTRKRIRKRGKEGKRDNESVEKSLTADVRWGLVKIINEKRSQ